MMRIQWMLGVIFGLISELHKKGKLSASKFMIFIENTCQAHFIQSIKTTNNAKCLCQFCEYITNTKFCMPECL